MKISKTLQGLFLGSAVAMLAACGGGSSSVPVAGSNTSISINPATGPALLKALDGKTATFAAGVAEFGTTGPTTVSFSGSNFTITEVNTGKTVTGPMTFGSCIFTAAQSSLLSFLVGRTITVNPCTIDANTAGIPASGVETIINVVFKFPSGGSSVIAIPLSIAADGTVKSGGTTLGNVTLSLTGSTAGALK